MKWNTAIASLLVLFMMGEVSAVKLEYGRFFPECSFEDEEVSFAGVTRCGFYLFIPNLHLEAGYDLTIRAFGDGIIQLFNREFDYLKEFLTDISIDSLLNGSKIRLLFAMTIEPLMLILDVMSGVIAYIFLMLFEFVKVYLFWFVLPLGSINLLIGYIGLAMNQKWESPLASLIINPIVIPLVITVLMIVGSISLVFMDIGIFNMRLQ